MISTFWRTSFITPALLGSAMALSACSINVEDRSPLYDGPMESTRQSDLKDGETRITISRRMGDRDAAFDSMVAMASTLRAEGCRIEETQGWMALKGSDKRGFHVRAVCPDGFSLSQIRS
ncbi:MULTISPECIES: hypothetical protein [unclassified Iodidimonas]|jgi:hypothetical protein|uniref:hypothetical protein n=1 Tax=unclassified Iodidimonas TaxID=2626145 RepID=UPI002482A7FE|nr:MULTISPECIES: hypothetical protein [unclassified Iodidimonas]